MKFARPAAEVFFVDLPGLNRLHGRIDLVYDPWLYPVFEDRSRRTAINLVGTGSCYWTGARGRDNVESCRDRRLDANAAGTRLRALQACRDQFRLEPATLAGD